MILDNYYDDGYERKYYGEITEFPSNSPLLYIRVVITWIRCKDVDWVEQSGQDYYWGFIVSYSLTHEKELVKGKTTSPCFLDWEECIVEMRKNINWVENRSITFPEALLNK